MAASDIHRKVSAQFAPTAALYATSAGHANLAVLAELVELTKPEPTDRLLDIATGAGHVALAFAPKVKEATAFDLTPSMLQQAEQSANDRGLTNVKTVQGQAESLPFPDGSFEIVTARLAPHHFADVSSFVGETARVLVTGGKFLLVDSIAPDDDELDRQINHLELLRDPSHVRNYRSTEWQELAEQHGFVIEHVHVGMHSGGTRMELFGWMDRIGTPETNRPELIGAFFEPTPELVGALDIRRENDVVTFSLPELTMLARKCG